MANPSRESLNRLLEWLQHEGPDFTAPLAELRQQFDLMTSRCQVPSNVKVTEERLQSCSACWIEPPDAAPHRVLLFVHGGGFMLGSARGFAGVAAAFAHAAAANALVPDYRLAPEHPYPAALNDVLMAYETLLERGHSARQIGLVGDSAGGALVMALLAKLKERRLPRPAAVALVSPWLDLACGGASMTANVAADPVLHQEDLRQMARAFLQSATVPTVFQPLTSSLRDLPPLMIHVGAGEVLLDDSLQLAQRAAYCEVPVTLQVWADVLHDFTLFAPQLAAARHAIELTGDFFRHHLRSA